MDRGANSFGIAHFSVSDGENKRIFRRSKLRRVKEVEQSDGLEY